MRVVAMRQLEHSRWRLVLAAVADIKEQYDTLLQLWPWSTLPFRDDLATVSATSSAVATAPNLGDQIEAGGLGQDNLRAGWRTVSQQFEQVMALGEHGYAISDAMPHSVNDCGWAGRLFFAHDHCLLIGGRLDGRHPRESTLVCISRGGHAVPPHAHAAVEICLETLAMKLSEVRWRRQAGKRCAFVSLSAPTAALCIGAASFPALVSCTVETSSCPGDQDARMHDGRRNGKIGGCRDQTLVIQATSAGRGSLRVRLRALAPWRSSTTYIGVASDGTSGSLGQIDDVDPKTQTAGYLVEIAASPDSGICVTPRRATLPVTVTLSLADHVSLSTMHGGEGSNGREQMFLTVAGRGVLAMSREIAICDRP